MDVCVFPTGELGDIPRPRARLSRPPKIVGTAAPAAARGKDRTDQRNARRVRAGRRMGGLPAGDLFRRAEEAARRRAVNFHAFGLPPVRKNISLRADLHE